MDENKELKYTEMNDEFKPKNFRNQQRVSLIINNDSEVKKQKMKNNKAYLKNLKICDPL
jgi:hypothetical protein